MNTKIIAEEIESLYLFAKIHDCFITRHRVDWPDRETLQKLSDKLGETIEVHPQISSLDMCDLVLTVGQVTLFKTLSEAHECFELHQRGENIMQETAF